MERAIIKDECELLTRKQVCDYFGISQRTLTNWVMTGRLPRPHRRGRNVMFYRDSVEKAADLLKQDCERYMLSIYRKLKLTPSDDRPTIHFEGEEQFPRKEEPPKKTRTRTRKAKETPATKEETLLHDAATKELLEQLLARFETTNK